MDTKHIKDVKSGSDPLLTISKEGTVSMGSLKPGKPSFKNILPPPMVQITEPLNNDNAAIPGVTFRAIGSKYTDPKNPSEIIVDKEGKLLKSYLGFTNFTKSLIDIYDDWIRNRLSSQITAYQVEMNNGYRLVITDVFFTKPKYDSGNKSYPLLPAWARGNGRTYGLPITVRLTMQKPLYNTSKGLFSLAFNGSPEIQTEPATDSEKSEPQIRIISRPNMHRIDTSNIDNAEQYRNQLGTIENIIGWRDVTKSAALSLGEIPLMVGSYHCWLRDIPREKMGKVNECSEDPFGYFIVGGVEKVLAIIERLRMDKAMVFDNKDNLECRYTTEGASGSKTITLLRSEAKKTEEGYPSGIIMAKIAMLGKTEGKKKKVTPNIVSVFQLFRLIERLFNDGSNPKYPKGLYNGREGTALMTASIARFVEGPNRINILALLAPTKELANSSPDPVEQVTALMNLNTSTSNKDLKEDNSVRAKKVLSPLEVNVKIRASIKAEIYPKVPEWYKKLDILAMQIAKFLDGLYDRSVLDNRDSWANKELATAGKMMEQLFRLTMRKTMEELSKVVSKNKDNFNVENLAQNLNGKVIVETFYKSFIGAKWGMPEANKDVKLKENISQTMRRTESMIASVSQLLTIDVGTNTNDKNPSIRVIQPSQWGFIDIIQASEGAKCGITKPLALTTQIGIGGSISHEHFIKFLSLDGPTSDKQNALIIDGVPIGWCNSELVHQEALNLRRKGVLHRHVEIILDKVTGRLYLYFKFGVPVRPVLVVRDNKLVIDTIPKGWTMSFMELLNKGAIEYISPWEQEFSLVAPTVNDLKLLDYEKSEALELLSNTYNELKKVAALGINNPEYRKRELLLQQATNVYRNTLKRSQYTHCEIDPAGILGIPASIIPFPGHNPAARGTYQCQMGRQAVGTYASNYINRTGDGEIKILVNPMRPIVEPQANAFLGLNKYPQGVILNVAFMNYNNFGQEDAIILNRNTVDVGMLNTTKYFEHSAVFKNENDVTQVHGKPQLMKGESADLYSNLNEDGIPILGRLMKQGHAVIGRIDHIKGGKNVNTSVFMGISEVGIVDKVTISTNEREGRATTVTVRLRITSRPNVGDKLAQRAAQKGIISQIANPEDMPFSQRTGKSPDIIINPNSIGTRMTISFLFEILAGKAATMKAERVNSSAFRKFDIDYFMDTLRQYGYESQGNEDMINGTTGLPIKSKIFTGPCYYQVLRHMVNSKIQARNLGDVSSLTGQPVSGKKRGGGIRFGEMERDAAISHGDASLNQDRLALKSDAKTIAVCINSGCGRQAIALYGANRYECPNCKGNANIGRLNIPQTTLYRDDLLAGLGFRARYTMVEVDKVAELKQKKMLYSSQQARRENKIDQSSLVDEQIEVSNLFDADSSTIDDETVQVDEEPIDEEPDISEIDFTGELDQGDSNEGFGGFEES